MKTTRSNVRPISREARKVALAAIAAVRRLEELDPHAAIAVRDFINADEVSKARFDLRAAMRIIAVDTHERKLIEAVGSANADLPAPEAQRRIEAALDEFREDLITARARRGFRDSIIIRRSGRVQLAPAQAPRAA